MQNNDQNLLTVLILKGLISLLKVLTIFLVINQWPWPLQSFRCRESEIIRVKWRYLGTSISTLLFSKWENRHKQGKKFILDSQLRVYASKFWFHTISTLVDGLSVMGVILNKVILTWKPKGNSLYWIAGTMSCRHVVLVMSIGRKTQTYL